MGNINTYFTTIKKISEPKKKKSFDLCTLFESLQQSLAIQTFKKSIRNALCNGILFILMVVVTSLLFSSRNNRL